MALVRRHFPPGTVEARPWDAPCAFSEDLEYLALRVDHRLSLVRCPAWAAMGVEERHASLVTALAGGWHAGRDASPDAGDGRGTRDDSLGVWRRGWRFFPLGRGAARASPTGGKARGSSSTASPRGAACPWRTAPRRPMGMSGPKSCRCSRPSRCAPANEAVRANDSGSSRQRESMMRKRCGSSSGSGVSGRRSRSASGRRRKTGADRSKKWSHDSKRSAHVPSSRRSIAAWWSVGSALPHVLRRFLRLLRSISGFIGNSGIDS